jgi:hypothetical protein
VTAHFIDSIDVLNGTIRRIQSLHRLMAGGADRFCDALIDCVLRIKWKHSLAGCIENHFTEGDPAQLLVFIQQPGNQLIHCRLSCSRSR